MAGVIVNPAAVVGNGAQVAGAVADSSVPDVDPIKAADHVTRAAVVTLKGRWDALVAYRGAVHQIIEYLRGMVAASGTTYGQQETANQGAPAPATVGAPPTPPAPLAPVPPV